MPRKKIVFVIVEGPSDDEALGVIIHRIYDKSVVHVEITHGDITSKSSVTPGNIAAKIGRVVQEYARSNHYKQNDFQEIIHLIDTDGAYIEKKDVVEDPSAKKPFYTTTEIRTARPDQIIQRNKRKSDNINRICVMTKVWGSILYRAYYMSANLDHLDDFISFIADSDFSVSDDFKQSWEFIKADKHSLERHTNLGICFKEVPLSQR